MSIALTYLMMSDAEEIHAVELVEFLKGLKADRCSVYEEVLTFARKLELDVFEIDRLISEIRACYRKTFLISAIIDALLCYRQTIEGRYLTDSFQ